MAVIKDATFPDRMRVKFLSDIPIEPDELEYLIDMAVLAQELQPEFDCCCLCHEEE